MKHQDLKQIRGHLGLSQAALGEEVGVRANTVARWERGEATIPKAVAKLLRLMAQAEGGASAVATSGAVARDSHHAAILAALNRRVDPDVFEDCAADLLTKEWPGLVPVRGGSDEGFDGAVASGDQLPFPLVTTTGTDAKSNLRRNLKRAIDSGWNPSAAIFATARRIMPKTRKALTEIANELGVRLAQIYDQAWFANALYRESGWCKKLLGVTGRPSALSVVPFSSRPLLGDRVLGRDAELEGLRKLEHDCLVVGGPGSGKTFVLRALALEGHGLFLTDNDRESIADAVREQRPAAIIVDDVHVNPDILVTLHQLRSEIRADFRIIAVSWPADVASVRLKLDIANSDIIELQPIDADTMVEIIKSAGLQGPNELISAIVWQAEGRPGLAVTLAHLCLRGDVRDVLLGDSLVEQLLPVLRGILGEDASRLLAAFSLGGAAGCLQEIIADFLQQPIGKISSALARLSTAGVIRQSPDSSISVWPEPFRWALVRQVFFGGPGSLNYKTLFNKVPNQNDAVHTLLGARSRGASIPALENVLEGQRSPELWSVYAGLGPSESNYVLKHHPELAVAMADAGLGHSPEQIIPLLLDRAVGDNRAFDNSLVDPLRMIENWVSSRGSTIEQRRALVSATERWWKRTREHTKGATRTAIRVLTIAFSSNWTHVEADPGRGRRVTFSQGILGETQTRELRQLWAATSALVLDAAAEGYWTDLLGLVQNWLYVHPRANLSEKIRAERMELAQQMVKDVAQASRMHPGIQHCLAELADRAELTLNPHLSPDFEVLYPREYSARFREQEKEWNEAVRELAARWKSLKPAKAAAKILFIEKEGQLAGITYPHLSGTLCNELAVGVTNPLTWAEELIDKGVPADLAAPFVRNVAEAEQKGAVALLKRCLESQDYRWVGLEILITLPNPPQELLNDALNHAGSFPQLIEVSCLRGEIPSGTLRALLTATDERVALPAAIGEWNADRRGRKDLRFPRKWRQVILRSARTDDLGEHNGYWIGEILGSNPRLARDWLIELLSLDSSDIHYRTMEVAKKAVSVLDQSQRVEVMSKLKSDHGADEIIVHLIGDDPVLYQKLLDMDFLSEYHLCPLVGPSDKGWAEKAIHALDAGYSVEEVVRATLPQAWSWSGAESAMWTARKEAFEAFLNHKDPRILGVAERGVEIMEGRIARCIDRERRDAIYRYR